MAKPKKYLYKGKKYRFSELAKLATCTPRALEMRLYRGWDVEKAVDTPQYRIGSFHPGFKVEYNGKKISVNRLSKETGLSNALLWDRIKEGKSVAEILKDPYIKTKAYEVRKGLCTRHEINQMAHDKSLSYNTIGKRLFDGWSIEEALNTPVLSGVRREMRFRVMYKGKDYTIKELMQLPECKVGENVIRDRLKSGWSTEDAIKTPVLSLAERARIAVETARKNGNFGHKAKKYIYKGKPCTVKELIALPECELSYNALFTRLEKGWDVERAVTAKRGTRKDNVSLGKTYQYNGACYTIRQLAALPECNVNAPTLYARLKSGQSVEEAMMPLRKRGRKKKAA